MFRKLLYTSLVLLFSGCTAVSNWSARRDFQSLCDYTTTFSWSKYGKDEVVVMVQDYSEGLSKLIPSGKVRDTINAAAVALVPEKWPIIVSGAREVGIKNYNCPSVKAFYEGDNEALGRK